MKDRILYLLKEYRPEFVSGEFICKNLGVSRTAIWKHIQSLRNEGYEILSRPHSGYRLLRVPDSLLAREILYGLQTRFIGRNVFYYRQTLGSTNELAMELAEKEVPDGSIVVTEEQTGGRGRLGRSWFSPYGKGIFFSLILYPPVNPIDAPPATMLVAVAVARAVEEVVGIRPGIKWPNDLLLEGKKFCGILTEMHAEMERIKCLVIGIGINVNMGYFPPEIRDIAISLKEYAGRSVSRVKLLQAFLKEMEHLYCLWLKEGFSPVLEQWKDYCVILDRPVKISSSRESIEGWAHDVDENGNLILRLADGSLKSFMSGEVSLRPVLD